MLRIRTLVIATTIALSACSQSPEPASKDASATPPAAASTVAAATPDSA